VRRDGQWFAERLAALAELPIVGEIRSIGLMAAIEIVADRAARRAFPPAQAVPARIRDVARGRGLICRANAEALMLCPPLITTRDQLDEIVAIVRASIVEVATTLS
jgi:L-2,4-diaminobutyrate transaminase